MVAQNEVLASVGHAIYEEQIRQQVEPADEGKLVVIDVNTADYEIDANEAEAWLRLIQRQPEAVIWVERIGYPVPYRMEHRVTTP